MSGSPRDCPVAASHRRAVPSAPAVASILPSGLNATAYTVPVCPASGAPNGRPVPGSQRRTVPVTRTQTQRKNTPVAQIRPAYSHGSTSRVPIQALTATATPRVQEEIRDTLHLGSRGFAFVTITGDFRRPNLVFRVLWPQSAKERDALAVGIVQQIVAHPEKGGSGIVYVATRREAERLARLLRGRNIAAQPYQV